MQHNNLQVIILAAGKGTRMQSKLPKVLHPVAGVPMLSHVLATAKAMSPATVTVVHGHGGEAVTKACDDDSICWVEQAVQQGTGHAVEVALPSVPDSGRVLVLYGDVPLLSQDTLQYFLYATPTDVVGILTAKLDDPDGFGRIVRDNQGFVKKIIEQKDTNAQQAQINEINTGIYLFPTIKLKQWIKKLHNNNAQNEFYLTDIIEIAVKDGTSVYATACKNTEEVLGVNNKQQLAVAERTFQKKVAAELMAKGVSISDPTRFDCRGVVTVGKDVKMDVNVVLEGTVKIGNNCSIAPNCLLKNVTLGDNVNILPFSLLEDTTIGDNTIIGPYARLRPGTQIAKNAKIGNFVEVKNSCIGEGSKVNHLSYVGDTQMDGGVNIGAGTITCNYDGISKKYKTIIKQGASIGSNTCLVAPVTVAEQSFVGAGSVITKDTSPGELTLTRPPQQNLGPWPRKE